MSNPASHNADLIKRLRGAASRVSSMFAGRLMEEAADALEQPGGPDEQDLRAELVRLKQWFEDRRDRPGCTAQAIHIGMALDAHTKRSSPEAGPGSEWIAVSERKPDHQGEVICFNCDSFGTFVSCAFYADGEFGIYPGVTHWMELPAAPSRSATDRSEG